VTASPRLVFLLYKNMKKAKNAKQKVLGRPKTGIRPLMGFRADPAIRASIVRWAELQPDNPTLSEAIRRLVELGLTVKTKAASRRSDSLPAKPITKPGRRARAQELAKDAIEKMADPAASPEERAHRQRRLTKGPEEFREVSVDQPKRKT
jgi:hypothetical protein